MAALDVLRAGGHSTRVSRRTAAAAGRRSRKGLLADARDAGRDGTPRRCYPHAAAGRQIVFCEPSCLSAVREDAPSLLRGEAQQEGGGASRRRACCSRNSPQRADRRSCRSSPVRPKSCFTATAIRSRWACWRRPRRCWRRIPGATVVDLDAGCCGMAGSFGYAAEHFDVSRAIGERRCCRRSAARNPAPWSSPRGTSCRHQVKDFTGERAIHPAVLLRSLLVEDANESGVRLARRAGHRDHRQLLHTAERRRAGARVRLDHRRLLRRACRSTT